MKNNVIRAERRDFVRLSRSRSALLLISITTLTVLVSACGSTSTPTPIPTLDLGSNLSGNAPSQNTSQISSQGSVTASGFVAPAQEAQLAFAFAGIVTKVNVAAGDQVKAGDVLVELDNASIQLEVEQAQRALRELTSQSAIAAAGQEVATAQKNLDDAQKKVNSVTNRYADNVTIDYLKDQVTLAQAALDRAREAYNSTAGLSNVDPARASAAVNVYNAQKAYNTALGNLNWYTNPPAENDVAIANANFDSATAALQEAEWYLAELKGETIPADATGVRLAQLQQARDTLQAAQDKLDRTQLRASISGAVTLVNAVVGEYVVPGQAVIGISDVNNLKVITTDLSERDVPEINVGQSTIVLIEALNIEIKGYVESISPVADTLGGDVIYKTTIALDSLPDGIRSGMSVTVNYLP